MHPVWWIVLILLAFSTAHSKIAGVLWGIGFLIGAWLEFKVRPAVIHDPVTRAAKLWFLICVTVLGIWMFCAFVFNELLHPQSAELNAGMRLVVGAAAVWWVVRRLGASAGGVAAGINVALVVGCGVALIIALYEDRVTYPSNAIVWSAAIAFWLTVLCGESIRQSASRQAQLICLLGIGISVVVILVSRTRGAYPVLVWPITLLFVVRPSPASLRKHWRALTGVTLISCAVVLASASWWTEKLRLTEVISDVRGVQHDGNFNTSTGVRVYLLALGWQAFKESPLIGIGAAERKRRIHAAGLDGGAELEEATQSARKLGHVHNAYLHHAMDGGVLSLTGFLLTIAGLLVIGFALRNTHPISAYQLCGIAFVHALTNISSVNFSHNYYALMLAISVSVVLLQARVAIANARAR